MDIRCRRRLRCELVGRDLLVLRDEDAPQVLNRLGGDLPDLLDRVVAGHSIERDRQNLVGRLDEAADAAHRELQMGRGDLAKGCAEPRGSPEATGERRGG